MTSMHEHKRTIERVAAWLAIERPRPSTPAWDSAVAVVRRLNEAVSDLELGGATAAHANTATALRACAHEFGIDGASAGARLNGTLRVAVADLGREATNLTSQSLANAVLHLLGLVNADDAGPAQTQRFLEVLLAAAAVIDDARAYDLRFHAAASGPVLVTIPGVGEAELPIPLLKAAPRA